MLVCELWVIIRPVTVLVYEMSTYLACGGGRQRPSAMASRGGGADGIVRTRLRGGLVVYILCYAIAPIPPTRNTDTQYAIRNPSQTSDT